MGDQDRDAILARRALFISATLAGLACTSSNPPAQAPEPESKPVEPPAVIVEEANPLRGEGDDGRPGWSELMAKAPPTNVPDMVSPGDRQLLESLEHIVTYRYEKLEQHYPLPDCAPSEAQCQAWAEAVGVLDELLNEQLGLFRCGYSVETTFTYLERLYAHARYIRQLSDLLLDDLDAAVVARANPDDSEAWERERQRLEGPPPQVCLSCLAPTAQATTAAVMFSEGEAQLQASADTETALQSTNFTHSTNRKSRAKLIVRGHASPDEDSPEQLGQARAETVAAALVTLGVPRADIEIRSYGAALPITHDPAEQAINRRVDFEVMLP